MRRLAIAASLVILLLGGRAPADGAANRTGAPPTELPAPTTAAPALALAPGFPVGLGSPTNGQPYTPTLFDLDGDGAAEIFVHGGDTLGLRGDGSFLAGWPTVEMPYMGYGAQGQLPGASVGDFDGDGAAEVLWALRDWSYGATRTWAFNARRLDGSDLDGFPQPAPVPESLALMSPFVLGDATVPGYQAGAAALITPEGPHQLAFFAAGAATPRTLTLAPDHWVSSIQFGDLEGDGAEELFAVTWFGAAGSLSLHAFGPDGDEAPGYAVALPSLGQRHVGGDPIGADLDADGDLEILIGYVVGGIDCFHHDGLRCAGYPIDLGEPFQVLEMALGNLAGGGEPRHLAVAGWNRFEARYELAAVDLASGGFLPGWPRILPPRAHPSAVHPGAPVLFDADGDRVQEIGLAHVDGGLHILSAAGEPLPGSPQQMVSPSISGAAVGDIDGDGYFEIVAATWDGWVYAWKTSSPAYPGRASWPLRAADARNTGVFRIPDPAASPCVAGDTTLCLNQGRFAVRAHGAANGEPFIGHALQRTADSGYFWFFSSSNYEVLIKVLDACDWLNRFWVYSAHLSDVEFTLDVRDTRTGREYLVRNPAGYRPPGVLNAHPNFTCDDSGASALVIDTRALPPPETPIVSRYPDPAVVGPCVPDTYTACLHGGQFRVHAEWTAFGETQPARMNALSAESFEALFFADTNVELTGKVLDGRALTGSYWVFLAGTTDVGVRLWIEDTRTGELRMQENVAGHVFAPAIETVTNFRTGPDAVGGPAETPPSSGTVRERSAERD